MPLRQALHSMSESWEPQGKFPYPHPKDAERGEKWVKG